jgi:carnitine-CoA ligase
VRRPTGPSMPCSLLGEDDLKVTAALQANQWLSAAELFEWRVTQLPYFALPRSIGFRDDLPRSPVGRVLKRELSEGARRPNTWDVEAAGIEYERQ